MDKQTVAFRKVFAAMSMPSPDGLCHAQAWSDLHNDRKRIIAGMRKLVDKVVAENRDLNEDESMAYDMAKDMIDVIDREMDTRTLNGDRGPRASGRRSQPSQPVGGTSYGGSGMSDPFARQPSNLVAYRGREGAERAYTAGKWLQAQLLGDVTAQRWCQDRGMEIYAAASEGINTKGGFLVPDQLSVEIIRLVEEFGVFRAECRVWPMSSDTLSIPRRDSGLSAYFIGENQEGTESDANWSNVTLTAKKLMALSRMSSEIAEDAIISVADVLAEEIALAFAQKEDECGFNGDGSATYGGITGITRKIINGNHTASAVDTVTANADTFAELALVDLSTLMSRLPQYARRNAKFYCSEVCWSLVFERILAASGGNAIGNFADPVQRRYLGYPVVISTVLPTSTGSLDNQVMMLFGDLRKAAAMGDRRELRLMLSEHRYYELDQVGIRGTERFDVNIHDLGNTTTAGPMVALIGAA